MSDVVTIPAAEYERLVRNSKRLAYVQEQWETAVREQREATDMMEAASRRISSLEATVLILEHKVELALAMASAVKYIPGNN